MVDLVRHRFQRQRHVRRLAAHPARLKHPRVQGRADYAISLHHRQKLLVREDPVAFVPVTGGWGKKGATTVQLRAAKKATVRKALAAAWANTAPKTLVRAHGKLY